MHRQHQPFDSFFWPLNNHSNLWQQLKADSSYQAPGLPLDLTSAWALLKRRSASLFLRQEGTWRNSLSNLLITHPSSAGNKPLWEQALSLYGCRPAEVSAAGHSYLIFLCLHILESPQALEKWWMSRMEHEPVHIPSHIAFLQCNMTLTLLHQEMESMFPPLELKQNFVLLEQ